MTRILLTAILIVTLFACDNTETRRDRFFLKGNLEMEKKEYKNARKQFSEALALDDSFALAYNNRGITFFEEKEYLQAVSDYNRAIRIDPDFTDAHFNRANALLVLNRYGEALEDLEQVRKVFPDSAYVHFAMGLAHTGLQQYRQGLGAFDRAEKLDPGNPEIYLNKAVIYYETDSIDLTKKWLEKAYSLDEKNPNYYNIKGLTALKEREYQRAVEIFTEGLGKGSADPFLLNNRGYARIFTGNLAEALKDVNQSILLKPDNLWAYRNKGIIAYRNGRYKDAERLFNRALSKREYVEELYSYMASNYQAMENRPEACKYLKLARAKGEETIEVELPEDCSSY